MQRTASLSLLVSLACIAAACGDDAGDTGASGSGGQSSTGGSGAAGGSTSGGGGGSSGSAAGGAAGSDASAGGSSTGGSAAGGSAGSVTDAGPTDGGGTDADATTDGGGGGGTKLGCPATFAKEVFRDDFDGANLDLTKWSVAQQNSGSGGTFTQLTKMLAANATVSQGLLRVASHRHCADPYPSITAEHPAKCAGTNYYSGAWLRATKGYAPGKGLMIFLAKMPQPVAGIFPALWARNTDSGANYGELDLIETWWDTKTKGVAGDPNVFFVTTWLGAAPANTTGNAAGPFANLTSAPHVWEVEWDSSASPPNVSYFYRDAPGAQRVLLRKVTSSSQGLTGKISDTQLKTILALPWRPYIDFAVQTDTTWHVGPDTAAVYDPPDLEVDSVIVCQP